jgi:hypothetical protein
LYTTIANRRKTACGTKMVPLNPDIWPSGRPALMLHGRPVMDAA